VTKPVWDDDIDVGDIIASARPEPATASEKKSKKQKKKEERRRVKAANAAAENDGGVDIDAMDAEADVEHAGISQDDEEWDGTEEMRKRKLNEYMEELYGLEFNDIVRSLSLSFFCGLC
jgi:protein KRI1